MVTIGVFIFSWVIFALLGDKKRIPELFPTAIFSAFLGLFTDLIMVQYELWSYEDPPLASKSVKLFLDFGIYPVVAFLFIQFIPEKLTKKIIYTAVWVVCAIIFEYFYLKYGLIKHHLWWNLWMSFFADGIIFAFIYIQYCFYARIEFRS
ncbi:CBO0543 family protein [Anaerobacillus sp. MEB173]|uniref:CBO0543 family protein n=1 Tax=Anaerobacillus sp. MEB173 TaxID=3383345 RepID=UPI003F8E8274